MNVSLTKKQQDYIASQIKSGDFQNASELVRDALRLHEIYRHKVIQDLRDEIERGWSGSTSKRSVKDIIESKRTRKVS
jgi:antitoxin ParD1/3/4